jgi:hypothetical protein
MINSRIASPRGPVKLVYEFSRDNTAAAHENGWEPAAGTGRLYINAELAGEERFSVAQLWYTDALYVGRCGALPPSVVLTHNRSSSPAHWRE